MKFDKKAIIFTILIVNLIIMACSTLNHIDPEDERLIEPMQNMIENWEEFFGDFGGYPGMSPPYIRYLYPTGEIDQDSGKHQYHIDISGGFYDYVGVFEVKPTGCGENGQPKFELIRLNHSFSTPDSVMDDRISEMIYVHPGTFLTVAGTNNLEQYGQYNQLLRLASEEEIWSPTLTEPRDNQTFYPSELAFRGNAFPGMCIEIYLNEALVDWVEVKPEGNWEFNEIALLAGENEVQISTRSLDERTFEKISLSLNTYVPPKPYNTDDWLVVKSNDMPNLWRNIPLEDIPIRSLPGERDPEQTIAIIHQFQVENTDARHLARYGRGVGHASSRCNIFVGDVLSALSIPFPTKNQANRCCGGGDMWIGPEFMYAFMGGSPHGITNIRSIWREWGKWELVFDAQNANNNQYQKLLDHLRMGKPAVVSRPDHIAFLRTDNLPDELNQSNIYDLSVAQAGAVNSNAVLIREVFSIPRNLRIFIHE